MHGISGCALCADTQSDAQSVRRKNLVMAAAAGCIWHMCTCMPHMNGSYIVDVPSVMGNDLGGVLIRAAEHA